MKNNMNGILRQAQQMQAKIALLQKELDARKLEVNSNGGAVKITITGKQQIVDLKLDPEVVDPNDVEGLEIMLKTAFNQAVKESQDMVSKAMNKVTGGLNIPGMF